MKVFIWETLDKVSNSWHTDGGLLVVAEDAKEAYALASKDPSIVIDKEPDIILELAGEATPQVMVFPNTGCC
jgi:hypothetical protein